MYLVTIEYALLTIIAFFVFGGPVNPISIGAKTAEAVVAIVGTYRYFSGEPA